MHKNEIKKPVLPPNLKQSFSATLNPNINSSKTTESNLPVTGISIPTSFALIRRITVPLQVPTKTIRSNSENYNKANLSGKFTSQDNSSRVGSH